MSSDQEDESERFSDLDESVDSVESLEEVSISPILQKRFKSEMPSGKKLKAITFKPPIVRQRSRSISLSTKKNDAVVRLYWSKLGMLGRTQNVKVQETKSDYNLSEFTENEEDLDQLKADVDQQAGELLNDIKMFNEQHLPNDVKRIPDETPQKDESCYHQFLDGLENQQQEIVMNQSWTLKKPENIEKELRESFIKDLQEKRKVFSRTYDISPYIMGGVPSFNPNLVNFQESTREIMNRKNNLGLQGLQRQETRRNISSYTITQASIDHYSYSNEKTFMVVKTVEEVELNDQIGIQHFIRVYVDDLNSEKGKNIQETVVSKSKSFVEKVKSFSFFEKMHQPHSNTSDSKFLNLQKFQDEKVELVSDSGLTKSTKNMRAATQTTSTLYKGQFVYFFKRVKDEWILHRFNFQTLESSQVDAQFRLPYKNGQQIYFAQQTEKSNKLQYSKEELDQYSKNQRDELKFLKSIYIQIVTLDLNNVEIYKLNDLKNAIVKDLKIESEGNLTSTRYNQIFIVNPQEEEPSYFEKLINLEQNEDEIHFFIFFNMSYSVLTIQGDPEDEEERTTSIKTYPYQKKQKTEGDDPEQEDNKNTLTKTKLNDALGKAFTRLSTFKNANQTEFITGNQIDSLTLKAQIRCVQSAHILKFDKHRPENSQQAYFEFDRNENQDDQCFNITQEDYVKIWFFMEEDGEIQLINNFHRQEIDACTQKTDEGEIDIEKQNQYYLRHIKQKIGYPSNYHKNQVKVTFSKNGIFYEDAKFVGSGLIEQLIPQDNLVQSQQNKNYLVGENDRFQYLYIFKGQNYNESTSSQFVEYSDHYQFQVIKIKNLAKGENKSKQKKQILQIYNSIENQNFTNDCEVSNNQLRLNQRFKGVISNWFSVQLDDDNKQVRVKPLEGKTNGGDQSQDQVQQMIMESYGDDLPGTYMSLNICDVKLKSELDHDNSQHGKSKARIRFIPKTYFYRKNKNTGADKNGQYTVVFEMRVKYKIHEEYSFVATYFIVKFSKEEIKEISQKKDHYLLRDETMVQYIIMPNQDEIEPQMKLSKEKRLANFQLKKLDQFHIPVNQNKSIAQSQIVNLIQQSGKEFNQKSRQTIINFEQIVDSKVQPDFIPFMSFDKKLSTRNQQEPDYKNYMIQSFFWHEDKLMITNGSMINLAKNDLQSIQSENSLLLWRTSDVYKIGNQYVVHYDQTSILKQNIERITIQEMQLKIEMKGEKTNIQATIIGRTEKLVSSIKSQRFAEKIHALAKKLMDKRPDEDDNVLSSLFQDPELGDLLMDPETPSIKNEELISAKAVQIPKHLSDGNLEVTKISNQANRTSVGLAPISQGYKTPFQHFGYSKEEKKERCFDITFYSRLSKSCILSNIFTQYEIFKIQRYYLNQMYRMKPILFKDFDFLLLHTYQTYELPVQMKESFFQPQELFQGKTMCDFYINDIDQLNQSIQTYMKQLEETDPENNNKKFVQQIEGSLIDMIIQNNPFSSQIIKTSELKIEEYLIISLDFNLKSQIMRCKEIKAEGPFKTIMDTINQINHRNYVQLLEHDLYQLLDPEKPIKYTFPFFGVSQDEELIEISEGKINQHCNFEFQLKGQDVPLAWDNGDQKIIINRFKDARNQIDQIKEKIKVMGDKIDPDNRIVSVRFKIVNFQQVKLGEKIRKLYEYIDSHHDLEDEEKVNCQLENFEYTFGNLDLAYIMLQNRGENNMIYELDTAQQIVEAQFMDSFKFFHRQFIFYLVAFVLPFYVELIMENMFVSKICYSIGLFAQIMMFLIEIMQMCIQGLDYFSSVMNWVDASQFILYCILFYYNINAETLEEANNMFTRVLKLFCIVQTITKTLNFIRIYEEYGFLVRMIVMTAQNLTNFMVMFFIITLIFSMMYKALGINVDTHDPFDPSYIVSKKSATIMSRRSASPHYPAVGETFGMILYSFRNAIGDFTTPNYDYWLDPEKMGNVSQVNKNAMIGLIWTIWFTNGILQVIMLLNFLIAVISQNYEAVVSQQVIYTYSDKAEINHEYYELAQLMNKILRRQPDYMEYMVFVESSDVQMQKEDSQWQGFINAMKQHINKSFIKFYHIQNENNKVTNVKIDKLQSLQEKQMKQISAIETNMSKLLHQNEQIFKILATSTAADAKVVDKVAQPVPEGGEQAPLKDTKVTISLDQTQKVSQISVEYDESSNNSAEENVNR